MDDLLPALVSDATRAPAQTSAATVAEVTTMINTNTASTEGYLNVSIMLFYKAGWDNMYYVNTARFDAVNSGCS